jgi:fatty acid desaturase
MKKNMGNMDRLIRLVVAVALAALYFTGTIGGTLGLVLVIVAAVFLLTSFVAWCPGYLPFKLSTLKRQGDSS